MDIAYSYLQAVFLVKSEQEWDKGREIMVQKMTFTLDLETQMDRWNPDGQMQRAKQL